MSKLFLGIFAKKVESGGSEPPPPPPPLPPPVVPLQPPPPPPPIVKPPRIMYDSTNAFDIPLHAEMVAGYANGAYKWDAASWERFPNAVKVYISVTASDNHGHVLDVETGDATPAQVPAWVRMRRASGAFPSIYVEASKVGEVAHNLVLAGLGDTPLWIADWVGYKFDWPGAHATQYDHPPHSGGHYDISSVPAFWPGIDS